MRQPTQFLLIDIKKLISRIKQHQKGEHVQVRKLNNNDVKAQK